MTLIINPALRCHYFPPGPRCGYLPSRRASPASTTYILLFVDRGIQVSITRPGYCTAVLSQCRTFNFLTTLEVNWMTTPYHDCLFIFAPWKYSYILAYLHTDGCVCGQVSRWSGLVSSVLSYCTSTRWLASRICVIVSTQGMKTAFTVPRWHNASSLSFATDSSEIMTGKVT